MTTLFLLKQVGFGTIAYNQNLDEILKMYNEETDNGRYCGYSIYKVNATVDYSKMGYVQSWQYINSLEGEKCELK